MNDQIDRVEELTRQSVREVFHNMLCMDVTAEPGDTVAADGSDRIIGSVGFVGVSTGVIYLNAGIDFARVITGRMLGIPEPEVESGEMFSDAFGELSNMVVGRVKSRLCDSCMQCTLTIPSIVRGRQLSVDGSPQTIRRAIRFRNCEYHLLAELLLKQPQAK